MATGKGLVMANCVNLAGPPDPDIWSKIIPDSTVKVFFQTKSTFKSRGLE